MQDKSNCVLTRSRNCGSPAPILCRSSEQGRGNLLRNWRPSPSLRQSRCLLTSATSCPRQAASTLGLGGAPALPSPGLTVDEIDSIRYFSGSGRGPGCGIGGKITRSTAVCALTFWKMADSLTTLALWPLLHSNREKCVYVVGQPCTNMHTAAVFFFLCYRLASKHSTKKV